MAEVMLRERIQRRDPDAATVASAGMLFDGRPAEDHAIEVMEERGIDLTSHRSRILGPSTITASSLVICMASRHLREVVTLDPAAFSRTFTLRELVGRADDVGGVVSGETLADWLVRANTGRELAQHLGDRASYDVADPVGRGRRAFRRTADDLDELLESLEGLLWP